MTFYQTRMGGEGQVSAHYNLNKILIFPRTLSNTLNVRLIVNASSIFLDLIWGFRSGPQPAGDEPGQNDIGATKVSGAKLLYLR